MKINSLIAFVVFVLGSWLLHGKADGAVTSSTVQGTILKAQESVADETLFDELDEGPGTASVQTEKDFSLTHLQLSPSNRAPPATATFGAIGAF